MQLMSDRQTDRRPDLLRRDLNLYSYLKITRTSYSVTCLLFHQLDLRRTFRFFVVLVIIICETCRGFMQVVRPDDVSGAHTGGYHIACRVCKVEIPVSEMPVGKVCADSSTSCLKFSEYFFLIADMFILS